MRIPEENWLEYVARLARLCEKAGQEMAAYLARHGTADADAVTAYAFALVQKYAEGSAELACQMYDAVAEAAGIHLPPAMPAEPAEYGEVARMVRGLCGSEPLMQSGVSRLVKRAGADTTLQNALRDGAEFAWVPHGDTCPFCIALASRGWQRISKKALKNGHAEHIHPNCDCEYAVRFDGKSSVAGYDPDKYLAQYNAAGGDINALRRAQYAKSRERINAQKRAAYAARVERKATFREQYMAKADSDRLSHYENAVIDRQKTAGYILNLEHETGHAKAVAFRNALGYTKDNASALENELLKGLKQWKVNEVVSSKYGEKYEIRMMIKGPNGKTATVKTIWQLDKGSDKPRLITAYLYEEGNGQK